MRFHILHPQHTINNPDFASCAYTAKAYKACKMFTERGHTVFHYGTEGSTPKATENVVVLPKKDWDISYGGYDFHSNFFKFDVSDHAYQVYNRNAIEEIRKRKQPNDFILPFWGSGHRPICDAHPDLITVEPGIGYAGGHWARFKIFESYAIYHAYYGLDSVGTCKQDWYDVVIPNYFDLNDFKFSREKKPYFLFLGRVYDGKGIHIAIQATEKAGVPLIVAGQNSLKSCGYDQVPSHVTEFGYANVEQRKKLMSEASGTIVASLYNEPFGGVQVESLLSGTPTITTDWGAFTENNVDGVTGYRCRTFQDFVTAIEDVKAGLIDSKICRDFAEQRFSLSAVAKKYEKYFQDVLNIYTGKGWYECQ